VDIATEQLRQTGAAIQAAKDLYARATTGQYGERPSDAATAPAAPTPGGSQ
jgi:hypothetical protein